MNNMEIASEAIHSGKRLQLNYGGHTRKVEVHSVGISKNGIPSMLAFQTEGGSSSRGEQCFKFMHLEKATSLSIVDEPSEAPRAGYRGGVRGMVEVYAQVPVPPEPEVPAETTTSH